jgi:hypothetical protein
MRREDALDGWGRKISYRVFSGAAGFTQAEGVSMTNCNTSLGAPITALASGSLCASGSPPPNTPAQFLGARGNMLVVQDMATTRNGNAFVLISHGESGYGAYLAEGATARTTLPNSSGSEYANTQASGPFMILARSGPDTPATDASHFDDDVTYMSISDLVANARLAARSWSQFPTLTATFSESAVNAALGFSLGSAEDTGRTSLSLGGFLITASASGATRNVGFEQSGLGGLGVIGGGSTSGDLSSSFGETLTFQLGTGSEFVKMDVALNAFQVRDNSPLRKEGAEISFWRAGALLQTTTINAWDRSGDPSRCLLRLPTGGVFDRMDLKAVDQTNGGGSSRFQVAGIMACTDSAATCATAISGQVPCPMSPPSVTTASATSISKTAATLPGSVEQNNPVSKGTGSGYRISTGSSSIPVWTTSLTVNSGTGTILAGNCLTIAGDANTYVVASFTGPGTLVLADPGLLQSIPSSTSRNITLTHCQAAVSFEYGLTCSSIGSSVTASPATINAGTDSTSVSASLSGLTCNTNYCFRAKAAGPGGTTTGNHVAFRTDPC